MRVQRRLDLGRRHREPRDLDHLLGPVGDVDPPFRLHPADVAGADEPVEEHTLVGFGREVAGHHVRAADDDLTVAPGASVLVRLQVDDAHLEVGDGQARRVEAAPIRVVDRIAVQAGNLGGAVRAEPPDARPLGDAAGDVLGDRRGRPHHVAERREVVALEIGVVGHRHRDRRRAEGEGHALVGDVLQHPVEVEARDERQRRRRRPRAAGDRDAVDVEQGQEELQMVLVTYRARRVPVDDRGDERAVRVPHRFRQTGGPRAERVCEVGVERGVRQRCRSPAGRAVDEVPERNPPRRRLGVDADAVRGRAGLLEHVGDRGVGDHDVGLRRTRTRARTPTPSSSGSEARLRRRPGSLRAGR